MSSQLSRRAARAMGELRIAYQRGDQYGIDILREELERLGDLISALSRVPAEKRRAANALYQCGFPREDAAVALGVSEAVAAALFDAAAGRAQDDHDEWEADFYASRVRERADAKRVACPTCGSLPFSKCVTKTGRVLRWADMHKPRLEAGRD